MLAWRKGEALMVSISACFSESYAEARIKFCSAAATAGGAIRSWFNPHAQGPNGERLFLDTAPFRPPRAANMLGFDSSAHRVGGHFGSRGADASPGTWRRAELPKGN